MRGITLLLAGLVLALPVPSFAEEAPLSALERAVLAAPADPAPESWQFGGWGATGVHWTEGELTEVMGATILTLRAGEDTAPILGLFGPYAVQTFAVALPDGGWSDTDLHGILTTGGPGDAPNWSVLQRTSDHTNEKVALGGSYWIDWFQTGPDGQKRHIARVDGLLTEGGGAGIGGDLVYSFNDKAYWNYYGVLRGTYEFDGPDHLRLYAALRHSRTPDGSLWFGIYGINGTQRAGWIGGVELGAAF